MSIPSELFPLIERLNQEFDETEQAANEALNIVRRNLPFFYNNVIVTQYFAYLNSVLFGIETYRRQVQSTLETISPEDVPYEIIQEAGEDLGTLLGKLLEAKVTVRKLLNDLEI